MITISKDTSNDKNWIISYLKQEWGSEIIITRGKAHNIGELPALIAWKSDERAGLLTYKIEGQECEVISLNSLIERMGAGRALLDSIREIAIAQGCTRLWLITTNDNTHALRFYQKYGFYIRAIHKDAIEQSRRLKPEIPQRGFDDIPIRDEIELEILL